MAKEKLPTHTTPAGVAIYPSLVKADTRFDPDGVFKTGLKLEGDDAEKLQALIDEAFDEQLKAVKKELAEKKKGKGVKVKEADKPYEVEVDEEGDETGAIKFNFKMKQTVKPRDGDPFTQKPKIFDAKGKPITVSSIWGGSRLRLAFQIAPYYTAQIGSGVTLRLKAVKVIELVEGGGANADSYGFGEEEDGYEGSDDKSPFAGDDDDAGDDSDF